MNIFNLNQKSSDKIWRANMYHPLIQGAFRRIFGDGVSVDLQKALDLFRQAEEDDRNILGEYMFRPFNTSGQVSRIAETGKRC